MTTNFRFIKFFEDISADDVGQVGGKNASLGEMYRLLAPRGVRVPNGFAVTANGYRHVLRTAGALEPLRNALARLVDDDVKTLAAVGETARRIVYEAGLPDDLAAEIKSAYATLRAQYGADFAVAVRSSATAEDLPTASFAGQQETFLHVRSEAELLDCCRRCFASLFSDRAIHYRTERNFDHFQVALSIGVQKMVRSDLAASGVMFTLDPETGFRDVVLVSAAYGLGETIVQGSVEPDDFYVFKPTLLKGFRTVLRRKLGGKAVKMVYAGQERTRTEAVSPPEAAKFCISDEEVLALADMAIKIERHYSARAGRDVPMDIEWAKDGADGQLYIVQARPETAVSQRKPNLLEEYRLKASGAVRVSGHAVGARIGKGAVRVILDPSDMADFRQGEVLVTENTSPDWEPVMKLAAAVVTNRGGRTCHAAIVARELGIPAVVGTGNATEVLKDGEMVTVVCSQGEVGQVLAGAVDFAVEALDVATLARPKTKLMLIVGNPDSAFQQSFLPNDGVGLARMEFIVSDYVKAHPMALKHLEKVPPAERQQLLALTRQYATPSQYFIERLAEGVGMIAAAFYPKPVIVRMSDFKSNEYASLLGGTAFEPKEDNPMLGFRGAARYSHPDYEEGFALECAAMKRVRQVMGFKNVKLMIPFCRRVPEAASTLKTLAKYGLQRGEDGLEVYVMCEIPNNVFQIDAFAQYFDGFSIGSNDLTQLTLGVDRDSALVAFDFDERDPGVKEALRLAVEGCRRNGKHSGICGQAPSDYPEMAEYLVKLGIESISLNPDSIVATTKRVLALEAQVSSAVTHDAA